MPKNYEVQPGDTLSKIASKHGFSDYREIYDHPSNALFRAKRPNPNLIFAGDIIVIPDKGGLPPLPSAPPLPPFGPPSLDPIMYLVSPPPLISQVHPSDCWAAGLSSFQRATGINPSASRENLKDRYAVCLSYEPSGSLPESCVHPVFNGEGCYLENVPPARFDYDSAKERLKKNGYFVAIRHSGGNVYHTLVVYGVGVAPDRTPNRGYFSVMNPNHMSIHQAGYENLAFSEQKIVAVGSRHAPGPRHIHPI